MGITETGWTDEATRFRSRDVFFMQLAEHKKTPLPITRGTPAPAIEAEDHTPTTDPRSDLAPGPLRPRSPRS